MKEIKKIPDNPSEIFKLLLKISEKSNCIDYKIGVIISDESNRIISTGYNYIPDYDKGNPFPKGSNRNNNEGLLGVPRAVHAEVSAVISFLVSNRSIKKRLKMYSIYAPCAGCAEIIGLLKIKKVFYFKEFYNDFGKLILKKRKIPFQKLKGENGL